MDPTLLAIVFLVVMGAAVGCFWRAFACRRVTPQHVRWAVTGTLLDVVGTIAVMVSARVLGWKVPTPYPDVAAVHRGFAYVASALVIFQATTGALRIPVHKKTWGVFLFTYTTTYALAFWAYAPLR